MKCFYCDKELDRYEIDFNNFNSYERCYCEHHYLEILGRKVERVDFLNGLYTYCARNHEGQGSRAYETMSRISNYFEFIEYRSYFDTEHHFRNEVKHNPFMLNGYLFGFKMLHKPRVK